MVGLGNQLYMNCTPFASETTAVVQSRQFCQHRHKVHLAQLKSNCAIDKQDLTWSAEQCDMVCRIV